MTYGKRLKRAREAKGWTRKELTARAGVSINAIATHELGQFAPSLYCAAQVAQALGVSLDWLAGLSDDPGTDLPLGE